MSKFPIEYFRNIYDECEFITTSISQDTTKNDLIDNEVLKRAIRSLEIIGEATKKIPGDIKQQWSDVPWRNIAGMRDKLIHDYIGVNYAIVRDVVKNKIPEIKPVIAQIIDCESRSHLKNACWAEKPSDDRIQRSFFSPKAPLCLQKMVLTSIIIQSFHLQRHF